MPRKRQSITTGRRRARRSVSAVLLSCAALAFVKAAVKHAVTRTEQAVVGSIVHQLVMPIRERTPWMLWHFRSWLCDKGIPCPDCTKRMQEAETQLGEVYDIVCDATESSLGLNVAGPNPLEQIKKVIES